MVRIALDDGWGLLRGTDEESEKVFTTYSNYLIQIAGILNGHFGIGNDLAPGVDAAVRTMSGFARVQLRPPSAEVAEAIQRHLRQAWVREGRLRLLAHQPEDLLPDLLPGAPTDAYYATYHAVIAYCLALGVPRPRDHTVARRTMANEIKNRSHLPPPWSILCYGRPTPTEAKFRGLPTSAPAIENVHNLAIPNPDRAWDTICKALRTTRKRHWDDAKERWRKDPKNRCKNGSARRRVPGPEAAVLADKLPPTSVFDFMYRLRTRCDYRDVDAFLEGIVLPDDARIFLEALLTFVHGTMTALETLIIAAVGRTVYVDAGDRLVARMSEQLSRGVQERIALRR